MKNKLTILAVVLLALASTTIGFVSAKAEMGSTQTGCAWCWGWGGGGRG